MFIKAGFLLSFFMQVRFRTQVVTIDFTRAVVARAITMAQLAMLVQE